MIASASAGAVGAGGGAADHDGGAPEPDQAVGDAVGQPALFAHFPVKPRREGAAAEDVIDDIAGHEIGIVAGEALPAEVDHRLRHVEIDHDAAAEPARRGVGDRLEVVLRRQAGEGAVDQRAGGLGVDVADDRDRQLVAREGAAHIVAQVVGGDARHRFQRALALAAVRMAGERGLPPAAAGETVGIGGVAPQRRQHLPAHALDRVGIEARRAQRQPQQIEGFVAVLVERAQRAVKIVAPDLETELDGVVFQPLVEGLAVEIAGALVEQIGGEVGGARFVRLVLGGAAVEGVVERRPAARSARAPARPRCRTG